jgi:hypothetical protein
MGIFEGFLEKWCFLRGVLMVGLWWFVVVKLVLSRHFLPG